MRVIPLFKVFMSTDVLEPVKETLLSGFVGQGKRVDEFETLLRARIQYPYLVTLNSATSAIHMALRMAGVTQGSEVVSTPLTCSASNLPILALGGKISWADVDPRTCNIDIYDAAKRVTDNTAAIVVVAWGGYPVRVDELDSLVYQRIGRRIPIIEDCAHAFGSLYRGSHIATHHGTWGAFSFQAIKQFTTCDGGMLVLPGEEEFKRAKLLRWYGIDREEKDRGDFRCEQDIKEYGWKFHMNDLNATIGIHQLPHLSSILEKHRSNAAFYREALSGISGIELLENEPDCLSASWLFTIKVQKRNDFIAALRAKGIVTSKVHERNDKHTCMKEFARKDLFCLEQLNEVICSIPVGWWCEREDCQYIVETIKQGW